MEDSDNQSHAEVFGDDDKLFSLAEASEYLETNETDVILMALNDDIRPFFKLSDLRKFKNDNG